MKNVVKVMTALENTYKGHRVEMLYVEEQNRDKIFIDGTLVGYFDDDFFNADFDNPEIEIKVKASIKDFINFIDYIYKNEKTSVVSHAIEKGVREWREESQRNS